MASTAIVWFRNRRYDPDDAYERQWVPELGTSAYPPPMIDHGEARVRALAAYQAVKAAR